MKISVVIPTRNRAQILVNTLDSLAKQILSPDEIIIIDASDNKYYTAEINKRFAQLPLKWIDSAPSVCIQRNIGIQRAFNDWIFLCDDDITIPENYLSTLAEYVQKHQKCGAVAGRLMQMENGKWTDQYNVKSLSGLLWRFVFQLPIWGDLERIKGSFINKTLLSLIKRHYSKRGNTFTLAGWPLITCWDKPAFKTSVYSLGANLIKRNWLLLSPYDEVLDSSGIGDNYGVAMGFPQQSAIHVLSDTQAFHWRATKNRLAQPLSYYRRVMALHYFIKRSKKFSSFTVVVFIWSLMGNALMYLLKRDFTTFKATLKAIGLILTNRNPYWQAHQHGKKVLDIKF